VAVLAVSDTHALIWYATGATRKLGREARRVFERADAGRAAVHVPTITLVEIADEARKGSIRFDEPFSAWCEGLFSSGRFFSASLSLATVFCAEGLYAIAERSDRLIAATAVQLGLPLITRDLDIGDAAGIEIIW
jgi:PIN domain nuclease of toxin-antitoxin system